MRKKLLYLLILIFFLNINTFGKKNVAYNVKAITTYDGLLHNEIKDMLIDSRGFLWVATYSGLNLYDGYDFKYFIDEKLGLKSIYIKSLCEDMNGNILVGTMDKGIFVYDNNKHRFFSLNDRLSIKIPNSIFKIRIDNMNQLWIQEDKFSDILVINLTKEYKVISNTIIKAEDKRIDLLELNNKIYLKFKDGLYIFKEGKIAKFIDNSNCFNTSFSYLNENNILFSSGKKLMIYNLKKKQKKYIAKLKFHYDIIYNNSKIYFIKDNNIMVAPFKNLSLGNFNTLYKNENYNLNNFQTYKSSLFLSFKRNGLLQITNKNNESKVLPSHGIKYFNIFETRNKNILAATDNGLYIYDSTFVLKKHLLKKTLVQTIEKIKDKLFFGTISGKIYSCDENGYNLKLVTSLNYDIRDILFDNKYIWIASYSSGLHKFDENWNIIKNFNSNEIHSTTIARSLAKDKFGNIIVTSNKGFSLVSSKNGRTLINPIKGLSDYYFLQCIVCDDGKILLGSLGKGLVVLEPKDKSYRNCKVSYYNTNKGLSSNVINSILQDSQDIFYLATNTGLNLLNLSKKSCYALLRRKNSHSFSLDEFASCKCANGRLIFGGTDGINYLDPNKTKKREAPNKPVLTDFKLSGNTAMSDSITFDNIFNGEKKATSKIVLNSNQNIFTFIFSTLTLNNSKSVSYRYKLDSFDKEWNRLYNGNHEAKYANIRPGKYKFIVEACNVEGTFSGNPLVIDLCIKPPFYFSTYALVSYFILFLLTILLLMRIRKIKLKRKELLMIAEYDKKKSAELLKMRTNLFTNISHDLRTPLTLILGPLNSIIDSHANNFPLKVRHMLNGMLYNCNLMIQLLNELMNFAKSENDYLNIKYSESNIVEFLKKIVSQFDYICEEKGIKLVFTCRESEIVMRFDNRIIEQIFYNLIFNAIKHSHDSSKINVSLIENSSNIRVIIDDSGSGISIENQDLIFKKFFSDSSINSENIDGTGIGLFLTKKIVKYLNGKLSFESEKGKGSAFIVDLPKIVKPISIEKNNSTKNDIPVNLDDKKSKSSNIDEKTLTEAKPYMKSRRKVLMIVDDELEIRNLLEGLFEDKFTVVKVENGKLAYEKAVTLLPDVIISDVMMPIMNGFQLCNKLKNNDRTSHIPIALLTAKASDDDFLKGYDYKADLYCPKPFNNGVLKSMVNSLVKNRELLANKFHSAELNISPSEITTTAADELFLKKAVQVVEDHISDSSFLVEDFANGMGVSLLFLNKKLKALVSCTAKSFIREIRIKRAAQLLKTGRYSVSEVTYEVGFSDLRYFRNSFQKVIGLVPLEYKKKFSNNNSKG